jgi:cytochrome c
MRKIAFLIVSCIWLASAWGASGNEELAKRFGCTDCHSDARQTGGPTYKQIAERYGSDAGARLALIETVKTGSKGKWAEVSGGAPMPPFSALLSEAEISELIDWIFRR